ncbi:cytochrome P450 [Gloeopeniophorella convolvens]|nr:cytochrome P450 [Gloeopeniophorella convolvens]
MSVSLSWTNVVAALLVIVLLWKLSKKRPALPLPPGPKGWPVIGNLLDLPRENAAETFTKWGEQYGPMVYVEAAGQPILILNEAASVNEILERKGAAYSDRPQWSMTRTFAGFSEVIMTQMYDSRFKWMRKIGHEGVATRAALDKFNPLFEDETCHFLKTILRDPKNLEENFRHTVGSAILLITHGYKAQEQNDPVVDLVKSAMLNFSRVSPPGAFNVDMVPALKYWPAWAPYGNFKKIGAELHPTDIAVGEATYAFTKGEIEKGTAVPSLISETLKSGNLSPQDEHNLKWIAASIAGGGTFTSTATICGFFLAMTLYPEVQHKAQEEIDRVIGTDRLPTLADRDSLPYIKALQWEVFRWGHVLPTGMPHRTLVEDSHKGYHIPKDTIVVANIQRLLNDPATYSNPEKFSPDRFIAAEGKPAEQDPRSYSFGFGRRLCPGKAYAEAIVWLTIARVLAALRISKIVENGIEITPEKRYSTGTIIRPLDLRMDIKARNPQAEALILA